MTRLEQIRAWTAEALADDDAPVELPASWFGALLELVDAARPHHGPDGGCCRCGLKVCGVRDALEALGVPV